MLSELLNGEVIERKKLSNTSEISNQLLELKKKYSIEISESTVYRFYLEINSSVENNFKILLPDVI
jgi:hypothetical protein